MAPAGGIIVKPTARTCAGWALSPPADPRDLLDIPADSSNAVAHIADAYQALGDAWLKALRALADGELDSTQTAALVLPDLELAHRKLGAVIAELKGAADDVERLRYEAAVHLPITAQEARRAEGQGNQ
jgi:hypothetical protein